MIRTEIRFKNASFVSGLEKAGYKSIKHFSRESGISYSHCIAYANLEIIFDNTYLYNYDDKREIIMKLLNMDRWHLFDQYREVVELNKGVSKKITTDIPVDKIISLSSPDLNLLEADCDIEHTVNNNALKDELNLALSTLKDREREVLSMAYGVGKYKEPKSRREMSKIFGISIGRIGQLIAKSLRRLRHKTRSEKLEEFVGQEQSI